MAAAALSSELADQTWPVKQLPAAAASQPYDTAITTANPPAQSANDQSMQHIDESAVLSSMASKPPPPPPPPPHSSLPLPLLPPPRSVHQPWHPYCSLPWYIKHSPSVRSGLHPTTVTSTHHSTYSFLSALSLTLRYPFSVLECGMSFYHRFYVRHSVAERDVRRVAAVCLFLASKVEDAPRRLIELVRQFEAMQQQADEQNGTEVDDSKDGERPASMDEQTTPRFLEHMSPTSSAQRLTVPYPASLSPAVSHVLAEQHERDRFDRLSPHEHELRTHFIALESEVLLANDFDFTLPLPSRYIRLLVRQLVLSPPRTDTGKGREGWEDEVRRIAWERAIVKGGELVVVDAMRTLQALLPTTACLHFSPQSIAVLCVLVACTASDTDIERMVELGGWVTVASAAADEAEQHFPDAPIEVKEEAADVRFSPSSFTSTTPSFSPLYAVSPSSPTTASPASLSSIQSSPAPPPAQQPTLLAAPHLPSTLSSSTSIASPHTAAWVHRVLPGVSVDELLSLFGLLCDRPPLSEQPTRAMNDMRRVLLGLVKPLQTRVGTDILDVLHVRGEYEALVNEMTEAKRLRELLQAQREAEEERRRREEEEKSREKREKENAPHRPWDAEGEPARPASHERQAWAPHSPLHAGRYSGRVGWHADKAVNQRQTGGGREGARGRGAGHRGSWSSRHQPPPPTVGWQSTVLDSSSASAVPPPSSSSYSHSRRAASPVRRRSPSPPPKRRRSPSRSPSRRSSNGRDRERDREREGRPMRENADRQRRWRSRSPDPDSPTARYRGGSRGKRRASPSPPRDRGRGRR